MSSYPDIEAFKRFLREHELKATPQRLAVHKAMMALGHASAESVSTFISRNISTSVTPASIYNILTQMTSLGLYTQRPSANSRMYFDITRGAHIHLYDSVNHEFRDVADDTLMEMVNSYIKKKRFKGYKVDYTDVQIVCHPTTKKKA